MGNPPSRAIIDLAAYTHNLGMVKRYLGGRAAVAAVIKANAYGHGLVPVAQRAVDAGVRMLGVATIEEGVQLREAGIGAAILVLVQPEVAAIPIALEKRLTLMLSDTKVAEAVGTAAQRAKHVASVHCKIDSGMGRQGFALESAPERLLHLTRISHIDIEGIATHFPSADVSEDPYTHNQIKNFRAVLKRLDKHGIPYELAHAANSAAIVNYHGSTFDMVRPGLMTYGVWPTRTPPAHNELRPALRWETKVTLVRDLEPGSSVGYGRTYTTATRMRAAVLPIGYADGYKHALSNRADVLIRGTRCPVRGSVCMDQIIVDVSHLEEVHAGDVATLIGGDGKEHVTVQELAHLADTIPYDVLTGIGHRVPREYVG